MDGAARAPTYATPVDTDAELITDATMFVIFADAPDTVPVLSVIVDAAFARSVSLAMMPIVAVPAPKVAFDIAPTYADPAASDAEERVPMYAAPVDAFMLLNAVVYILVTVPVAKVAEPPDTVPLLMLTVERAVIRAVAPANVPIYAAPLETFMLLNEAFENTPTYAAPDDNVTVFAAPANTAFAWIVFVDSNTDDILFTNTRSATNVPVCIAKEDTLVACTTSLYTISSVTAL